MSRLALVERFLALGSTIEDGKGESLAVPQAATQGCHNSHSSPDAGPPKRCHQCGKSDTECMARARKISLTADHDPPASLLATRCTRSRIPVASSLLLLSSLFFLLCVVLRSPHSSASVVVSVPGSRLHALRDALCSTSVYVLYGTWSTTGYIHRGGPPSFGHLLECAPPTLSSVSTSGSQSGI